MGRLDSVVSRMRLGPFIIVPHEERAIDEKTGLAVMRATGDWMLPGRQRATTSEVRRIAERERWPEPRAINIGGEL